LIRIRLPFYIIPGLPLVRNCVAPFTVHLNRRPNISAGDGGLYLGAIFVVLVEGAISDKDSLIFRQIDAINLSPFFLVQRGDVELWPEDSLDGTTAVLNFGALG
jgi:hypothetical protein